MKQWKVLLIVVLLTIPVYAGAVSNGWTFDDNLIIRRNAAAHSLDAAWKASLSPYWPVTEAGQYRPLVVLSYALDWTVSRGNPAWLHAVNVVLHALASALLALVALRWVTPLGAVLAGVLFAWHPVHVEAVANVVGRAEVLTGIGLLAAVLAARGFRHAERARERWLWGAATVGSVLVALLSKEHGVVAIALIAADQALERRDTWRTSAPLYLACAAATIAWLFLWWKIAGRFVPESEAAVLDGLSGWERLATMLPAQLDVVRLLTWPSNLAADYNPLLIPQRRELTWLALLGLATTVSVIALGALVARRAPAITFGIVVAVVTYAPTSNLLFGSGVPLAERNLYMAAAATAIAVGWLASIVANKRFRLAMLVAVGTLAAVYAARSVTRVPFWKDDTTAVIDEFVAHPANYRNHLRLASTFVNRGDTLAGLAQGMVAARLFPEDPWVPWRVVPWALAVEWDLVARDEAGRAAAARPREAAFQRLLARVFLTRGQPDSALVPARRAVIASPTGRVDRRLYIEVLDSLDAPAWRRRLAEAHVEWLEGRFAAAGHRLDEAVQEILTTDGVRDCWDVDTARELLGSLRPSYIDQRPEGHGACGLRETRQP